MADPLDARLSGRPEFWFRTKPGADVHAQVVQHGKWLRTLYASFHRRMRMLEWLYDGSELRRHAQALETLQDRGFTAARLNVSEAIIDTLVSRLSKSRAMPSIVVTDADWDVKRRSKQYRKFIIGEMIDTEFDQLSREALLDTCVVGNGFTRIDDGDDKVFAERVLWDEILFDPRETKYGKPSNAFRIHRIAKDHLAELYPKYARQIADCASSALRPGDETDDDVTRSLSLEDYVDVFEAWHPERSEDDGRHVLCIENATLVSEAWDCPRYPIAGMQYKKSRRGIWARGLMHKLKDVQHRINCIVRDLQMNIQAVGRGFFLQPEQGALPVEALTGWQPYTVKYRGQAPPQWTAPQPFNPAALNALEFFIKEAYELSGVSQAAASSRSALGNGASGIALDTQYDIESERFAMQEAAYADYRLSAAQLYVDAAYRVAEKRKNAPKRKPYISGYMQRDAIEQLEYDKVALDGDQYKLKLEPTNYLADSKAGKLSEVGQLAQSGVLPQWLVAALFDEPDLERIKRYTLSGFWNAERKMDQLCDLKAEVPMPAPYNDLDIEMKMTIAYLNYYEAQPNVPPEVLDRFRQYLDLVKQAVAAQTPPAPPPGPGMNVPGGAPQMPGAAPMLPPGAPMPQG